MNIWRTLSSLEFFDTKIYQYRGKDAVQHLSAKPPNLMLFRGTPDYVAQFNGESWIAYDYVHPLKDIIGLDVEVEVWPDDFGAWIPPGGDLPEPSCLMSNDAPLAIYFFSNRLKVDLFRNVMSVPLYGLSPGQEWMKIRWKWDASGQSVLYLNDQQKAIKSNVSPNILMPMPSLHIGGGKRFGNRLGAPFRGYIKRVRVAVLTRKMRDLAVSNGLCAPPLLRKELSAEDLQQMSEWSYKLKRIEDEVRKMLTEYPRLRKRKPGMRLPKDLKIHPQAKKVASRLIFCPPKESASEEYKIRVKMIINLLKELKKKNPTKFCKDLGEIIKMSKQLVRELPTLKLHMGKEIICPEAQEFLKLLGEEIKRLCSNDGGRYNER